MNAFSVRDARRNFKALLDRVAAGEEITILRHGKPVARVVPPPRQIDRLPELDRFRASIAIRGEPLGAEIIAERGEERA